MTEASSELVIAGVTKQFGDFLAVDGLSLTVPEGAFFALLGPSGCGKTTTLRMVAGLETPTSGSIRLGALDITDLKPYRRPVNTVFQSYALFPHLTIFENVAFGLRRTGAKEVKTRVDDILDLVELGQFATRRPQQLSGGQQQRVALARALMPTSVWMRSTSSCAGRCRSRSSASRPRLASRSSMSRTTRKKP